MSLALLISFLRSYGLQLLLVIAVIGGGMWALDSAEQRGWDRRDAQAQKEAAKQQASADKELRENIADTATREQVAIQAIEQSNEAATTRADTLDKHLARQERARPLTPPKGATCDNHPAHAQPALEEPAAARPLLGHSVLDARTVRVLNDARQNAPAGPAPGGATNDADAEGEAAASAPTTITGRLFADNDLEVVRLYHELATRHNGLVDWVTHQCVPENPQPTH